MKLADRVEFSATGTSAATITVGAAPAGMRTPAQAVASGEFSATEANVPFVVKDTAGNWEAGRYTLSNGGTTLTQTVRLSSSNGGAAVTFNGSTLTVTNAETSADLNVGLINPHDIGFDIWLCAGQSNMVGQDQPVALTDFAHPNVFQFGGYSPDTTTYQKIVQAVDPMRHNYTSTPTSSNSGMGPGSWFGKSIIGLAPHRKILLVPVARSATAIYAGNADWSPGDSTAGNVLYENAISQANLAIAAAKLMYPNSRFCGTIWLQGESDADGTVNILNYKAALSTLIYGFRQRITGAANSMFIMIGMIGEYVANAGNAYPGYPVIDNAHRQIAAEIPRCAYVQGLTGYQLTTGNVHYNATAARILGCNAAAAVAYARENTGIDTTPPAVRSLTVPATNPSRLTMVLTEPVDPNFVPAASAFAVTGHTVSSVSVAGNTVYLTFTTPFVSGEATRTVTYTQPATNGLRDLFGNLMATYGPGNITNNAPAVDNTPPTLSAATVPSGAPATLTLTASESLDTNFVPAASAFTVTGHTVTGVGVAAGLVTLTLGEVFVSGEAARTVMYTQPASGGIRDLAGNLLATFPSALSVTNNAPATDTTAPTFSSAQVANASPTVVQITMSESLGASTPPTSAFAITENGTAKTVSSVSVSGAIVSVTVPTPFSTGTTIAATYTAPGTDPRIKDVAGNVAVSFGPVTVTNNVAAAGLTDIRFGNLVNMNETSAVAPYAYAAVNYAAINSTVEGGTSNLALAGDGTFFVKINYSSTTKNMVGMRTSQTAGAYNTNQFNIQAGANYGIFVGTGTQVGGNRAPADGDILKFDRTGTTVQVYVSSNNGTSYTQIFQLTGVATGTLYVQMMGQTGATFTAPQGTGFA